MGSIFGIPTHERTRMAIVSVDDSILQIQSAQDKIKQELFELAVQVRQTNPNKLKNTTMENSLRRSRAKRQQLTSLNKKLILLESQKDTLQASEVNQQVFSSIKNTSAALKSIGLDQTLTSVDEVMIELSESNADVRSIQEGLSENLTHVDASEEDLADELRYLLEDDLDTTTMLLVPETRNKMSEKSETPDTSKSSAHTKHAEHTQDTSSAELPVDASCQEAITVVPEM